MNIVLLGNKLSLYSGHSRPAWRIARHVQQLGHSAQIVSSEISDAGTAHHDAMIDSEGYHDLRRDHIGFPISELRAGDRNLRRRLEPVLQRADIVHFFDMRALLAVSRMFGGRIPGKTVLHQVSRPNVSLREICRAGAGGAISALTRGTDTASLLAPRWFVGRICRLADAVSCTSPLLAKLMAEKYGLDGNRIHVVPPGVDMPNGVEEQPADRPDFIYFGWAGAHRGTLDAAEAFARFLHRPQRRDAKCLVATFRRMRGLGEEFFTLRALKRYESRGVKCGGFIPHIRTLLNGARAAVLPFRTRFGYALPPLVALEAMAAGTPVISTNLDYIREFIRDGENGLLVAPGDINAIVGCMERLWSDDDLHGRLSASAKRTVRENFTTERFLAGIMELYQKIAEC